MAYNRFDNNCKNIILYVFEARRAFDVSMRIYCQRIPMSHWINTNFLWKLLWFFHFNKLKRIFEFFFMSRPLILLCYCYCTTKCITKRFNAFSSTKFRFWLQFKNQWGFFYWCLLTQIRMNDSIPNNHSTKYFNSVRVGPVEIEKWQWIWQWWVWICLQKSIGRSFFSRKFGKNWKKSAKFGRFERIVEKWMKYTKV